MSQPTDRLKDMEPIGEIDEARGEFWIPHPWKMNRLNFNVSAYEPNQVFLNIGPRRFAEIGYLTDADSDGDGRGILAAAVTGRRCATRRRLILLCGALHGARARL